MIIWRMYLHAPLPAPLASLSMTLLLPLHIRVLLMVAVSLMHIVNRVIQFMIHFYKLARLIIFSILGN